jgi:hypothetical protein
MDNENKVVIGFIKHNYRLFKSKVHWGLVLRTVPGFSFVINQFITQYLLKTVTLALSQKDNKDTLPQHHFDYINLLGVAYIANFLFSYLCDYIFATLRLGGCVSLSLRSMCVDTVIQLSSTEIEEFDVGRIIKTSDKDVDVAIKTSWIAGFNLCGSLIKLLFMISFLCYTTNDQANLSNKPSINWLMIIPFGLIICEVFLLLATFGFASKRNKSALDADEAWSAFLAQISSLRQAITSYRSSGFVFFSTCACV